MPKDPSEIITHYPPERVYHLLLTNFPREGTEGHLHAGAARTNLIHAYNRSPDNIDGILMRRTQGADNTPLLILNDVGIQHPDIKLRDAVIDIHEEYDAFKLSSDQNERRKKPSVLRRLGEIAATFAAVDGTMFATTGHDLPGALAVGSFAAAALYGSGRVLANYIQQDRATKALNTFMDWAEQPNNGAIVFRRHYNLTNDARKESTVRESIILSEEQRKTLKWLNKPHTGFKLEFESADTIGTLCQLTPGKFVEWAIRQDHAPAKLWTNGFGEQVRTLAKAEQDLISSKLELEAAEGRRTFTGHALAGELEKLKEQVTEHQQTLLRVGLEMGRQVKARREAYLLAERKKQAAALIDTIASGEVDEPHQLEMHLQELHDIANTALAGFDLEHAKTAEIAWEVGRYLQGTRARLSDHNQVEQFYKGLADMFRRYSSQTLPEWEAIAHRFPGPVLYAD